MRTARKRAKLARALPGKLEREYTLVERVIERVFRYVEMVGITALLAVVVSPMGRLVVFCIAGGLASVAGLYLILPMIRRYAPKTTNNAVRQVLGFVAFIAAILVSIVSTIILSDAIFGMMISR